MFVRIFPSKSIVSFIVVYRSLNKSALYTPFSSILQIPRVTPPLSDRVFFSTKPAINHMQTCIDSILIICRANIFLCQPRLNRHILFRYDESTIVRMVIRMSKQRHQSTMFLMKSYHAVEINIKNGIRIQKKKRRLNKIFISSPIFHWEIYSVSSRTISSKSVISLRPLTCHIPVMPGLMAILALW